MRLKFQANLERHFSQNGNMNCERPFGGKVVVFGGDFRQTLPIVQGGTRQDIVNASFCSSYLWGICKLVKLTKSMRLTVGSDKSKIEETKEFANWLLDLGEGKLGGQNDETMKIQISLVKEPYSPMNEVVEEVNDRLLSMFPEEEKEYLSSDTDENVRDTLQENMYSPDVFKWIKNLWNVKSQVSTKSWSIDHAT
ncbi:uncharacterized protein LOC143602155 [Bidens hawaiensis]|uniref:uncharacterized protein LOC143602155 n=1 Tax=Bidens hawaiensis TaxID=980011 RepID=UPI00404A842E